MNTLAYIISVNACLLIFYVLYRIFLAKETFFMLNRFVLLGMMVLAFVIPSIQIELEKTPEQAEILFETLPLRKRLNKLPLENTRESLTSSVKKTTTNTALKDKTNSTFTTPEKNQQPTTTFHTAEFDPTPIPQTSKLNLHFSGLEVAILIYVFGVILLIIRGLKDFTVLTLTIRRSKIIPQTTHKLIHTEGRLPTLSFFNYLFWDNTAPLSREEQHQILQHELAHIKQYHTLDVLFVELLCVLFWFNPAVYWLRKAVKEVHEYLADAAVLHSLTPNNYAKLLMAQVLGSTPQLLFSNHFMQAQIKKRIKMMTQKNSKISNLWKYVLLVPVLALLILAFGKVDTIPSDAHLMQAGVFTVHEGKPLFLIRKEIEEKEKQKHTQKVKPTQNQEVTEATKPTAATEASLASLPTVPTIAHHALTELPVLWEDGEQFYVLPDSTKKESKERFITWWKKGKKYELKFNRDDDITEFKVDGKVIPKAEYDQYFEVIEGSRKGNFAIRDLDDEIEINLDGNFVIDIDDEELKILNEELSREMTEMMVKMPLIRVLENEEEHDHGEGGEELIIINGKRMAITLDETAWEKWGEEWEKWGDKWEEWAEKFEEKVEERIEGKQQYHYKFKSGSSTTVDNKELEKLQKELEKQAKEAVKVQKEKEQREREIERLRRELEKLKQEKEKKKNK